MSNLTVAPGGRNHGNDAEYAEYAEYAECPEHIVALDRAKRHGRADREHVAPADHGR
ncbi:MAG TPA: hypothetical protein VK053_20965 [Jiangellaceae bacterium]|nr:hypothetical protein [Jiangellaceae bacterium]